MRKCELCNSPARLFCESDQASLCWDCDAKVHTANFIVSKHARILLCHVCQSLTPWHASGPKFLPTISVCDHCVRHGNGFCGQQSDDDDGDSDDTENDSIADGEEENQVVPPWKSTPPPSASSSSNMSECADVDSEERVSD